MRRVERFPESEGRFAGCARGRFKYRQIGLAVGLPEETKLGVGKSRLLSLLTQSLSELDLSVDPIIPFPLFEIMVPFGPLQTDSIEIAGGGFITEVLISELRLSQGFELDGHKALGLLRESFGEGVHLVLRRPKFD